MVEYTKEQIDAIIADAKKGLFGEDELNRRVTSEVDRRVESGIQKGLETYKSKWEKEFSEKAKLTAEELAQKEINEKLSQVTEKEKAINKKANLLEAKSLLSDAEVPKSHYEKLLDLLVSDDGEVTKSNVQSYIDTFKLAKSEIEVKLKTELSKMPPPNTGGSDKPVTKDDFVKMSYSDKLKFKSDHPEQYKEFMK